MHTCRDSAASPAAARCAEAATEVAPERRRAAPKDDTCVLIKRRRPTLPGPFGPSTIGAERLNCTVRNGKRCFPLAIATEKLRDRPLPDASKLHSRTNERIG